MAMNVERPAGTEPNHPGEVLDEIILPATGKTKTEIARLLHLSRQTLYDILAKRQPVTPVVAARLGKLFGNGAGFWIRLQGTYDTWHAERDVDTSDIPTLEIA